jgi:hypothetical protein
MKPLTFDLLSREEKSTQSHFLTIIPPEFAMETMNATQRSLKNQIVVPE